MSILKNHTKTYLDFFGYQIPQDCCCECCGAMAIDINHVKARGMGGNPAGDKDHITNLMAMCRECHVSLGDVPEVRNQLTLIHLKFMKYNGLKVSLINSFPVLIVELTK